MIFSIIHTTSYKYDNTITYCHNLANLKPRNFIGQELLDYELIITPKPTNINENIDFFGNNVSNFSIEKQHKELIVTAKSKVKRSFELQENPLTSEICKAITLEKATIKLKSLSSAKSIPKYEIP